MIKICLEILFALIILSTHLFFCFLLFPFQYDQDHFESTTPLLEKQYIELNTFIHQRKVNVNGIELNLNEFKPKTASKLLVFIHGFPETGLIGYKHQLLHFSKFEQYHVVAPDLRGYNTSTKCLDPNICNPLTACDDIASLIRQLNYSKAYVVGHDWGAAVAWLHSLRYPELTEKLIILNGPHVCGFQELMHQFPITFLSQIVKSWYMYFFQFSFAEKRIYADSFSWLINFGFASSKKNAYSKEDIERFKESWSQPDAITSVLNYYRYFLIQTAKDPEFAKKIVNGNIQVKVPTLVIWGTKDIYLHEKIAEVSTSPKLCENCILKKVSTAGHWILADEPILVNSYIQEFIQQ